MAYEYNLRGLFRPQLDQLPLSEQLVLYQQRDMTASHLYRVGATLFGGRGITTRRRLIDSSQYSSTDFSPHATLFNRSLSDSSPHFRMGYKSALHSHSDCSNIVMVPPLFRCEALDHTSSDLRFAESNYLKWIADRRRLRESIEGLDALKHWLMCKEQTPMESHLLTNLRTRKVNDTTKKTTVEENIHVEPTEQVEIGTECTSTKIQCKSYVLREITQLEHHLLTHRPRLVQMLTSADKQNNKSISVHDMLSILSKMKIQMSQQTVEILLDILKVDGGLVRYDELLQGGILRKVTRYFQQYDSEWIPPKNATSIAGSISSDNTLLQLEEKKSPSTMDGKNGILADEYKQEELKQFTSLLEFCKEKGITLDWKLAEKALLLPPDHTKRECLAGLRQPGLDLLSHCSANPPEEKTERTEKKIQTYEGWGRPYKELRGRKKANYVRLSTGKVRIQPKTDCWLTFHDYLKLTEHIRSKPGFKYKDHGLPNNHAFWPGVMMDKLRLWLPNETLLDKPYSLYNIFQPVQLCEARTPLVGQKSSWPENNNGYVQFGSQTRKRYHI